MMNREIRPPWVNAIIELDFDADDAQTFDQTLGALTQAGWNDANLFPRGRIALGDHSIVSGAFDEARLEQIQNIEHVAAVFDDPDVTPFVPEGTNTEAKTSKGKIKDIAASLMNTIWAQGHHGRGVRIAICDSGIDRYPLLGLNPNPNQGWTASAHFTVGEDTAIVPHGTMVAYDALAMADLAEVLDIGLLKMSSNAGTPGLSDWKLSVAIAAYRRLIDDFDNAGLQHRPYALILCNSWGLPDPQAKWNTDHYATNPNHPFTRLVVEAMDKGIIVVFAAGNSGENGGSPFGNPAFSGPGKSIWGANGHPRVITVGAVDQDRLRMGYSSQGPSALAPNQLKPDVCGISQFSGFLDVIKPPSFPDAGTSAATPIVAAGLAVLKGKYPRLTQDVAGYVLRETADHPGSVAGGPRKADQNYGHGVVNFEKADQLLAKIYL